MKQTNQPNKSFLLGQLEMPIDFIDVYSASFNAPHAIAVECLVKEFFYCMPKGALWLLSIREFIAKQIGLKTANGKKNVTAEIQSFQGCIGEKIGLFEVWCRNENEIVTGQRDKHLDFGLSFYIENDNEKHIIKLTTIVKINSFLGKVYFFLVKPIHKLLMPTVTKRLSNKLKNSC